MAVHLVDVVRGVDSLGAHDRAELFYSSLDSKAIVYFFCIDRTVEKKGSKHCEICLQSGYKDHGIDK